jgi:hypothetical protein
MPGAEISGFGISGRLSVSEDAKKLPPDGFWTLILRVFS